LKTQIQILTNLPKALFAERILIINMFYNLSLASLENKKMASGRSATDLLKSSLTKSESRSKDR